MDWDRSRRLFIFLSWEEEEVEEEEEEADASDLLPLLFVAALVVDSGSGTLALLVFLVTFLFALCSLWFLAGS